MIEKNDWRLAVNGAAYLKNKYMNPTDGEEIVINAPYLDSCVFCLEKVKNAIHRRWFLPEDISCCICEECYHDFREMFGWELLDGWDIVWPET